MQPHPTCLLAVVVGMCLWASSEKVHAENWPRWRGPNGAAISSEKHVPLRWTTSDNVAWKAEIPGEGSSSPIVFGQHVFVTSALEDGLRRQLHCLDRDTGRRIWMREIVDDNPEITSALTGHAASTPVTDGKHVVAFFGNAGLVAYDFQGRQLWHHDFGEFESELGIASSPILVGDRVIQVCDHDGKFYRTFDSFMICLDVATGRQVWRANRRGLERSWSTPIVVPAGDERPELIVNAEEALRGYSPDTGDLLWQVRGMTGWVTPSPVYAAGLIFATSGKDGPLMAIRPGGKADATSTHVAWQHKRGGPYVCSPLVYRGRLYVLNEFGVLNCYRASNGERLFRQRLAGKFTASAVAVAGHLMFTNESGRTYVLAAADDFRLASENQLENGCLASPAISQGKLFLRTEQHLWCIAKPGGK
jgi:outer membrane protein assembly factor BamB